MEYPIYKISDVHKATGLNKRKIQRYVKMNKRIDGFEFLKYDDNGYALFKKDFIKPTYTKPAALTAEEILNIENAYVDLKGNITQVAKTCRLDFWTCYRYLKGQFKPKDQARADKGKSRALKGLSNEKRKEIRGIFESLLLKNVQHNVKLTIEKVKQNTGIKIPQRLAYEWADKLSGTHEQYHYYQKACAKNNIHVVRDLWTEYKNFLDCVMADEWKIDEFGVWINWKDPNYDATIATAYLVAFYDVKTRYPLSLVVTPHSTTTADTMKAAMELIRDWGLPKQWLFEHGKTWKSDQFLRFLHGLYEENDEKNIEFMDYEQLVEIDRESPHIHRARVKHPQAKPIERIWRIIKDEFCAYSPSYSPNPELSRKPTLYDSHPGVHRTFEELRRDLSGFIYTDFIERERTMFFDRKLSFAHEENKRRPKTIKEAFEITYATYNRVDVDPFKLAYHYGEKYTRKYKGGTISFIYPVSKEKMSYIPEDPVAVSDFIGQSLTVIINQYDIYTGWVFNGRQRLCDCTDMRKTGIVSKDQANVIGKLNRQVEKFNKKKAAALEELAKAKQIKVFKYEQTLPEAAERSDENYLIDRTTGEIINEESFNPEPEGNSIDPAHSSNCKPGEFRRITFEELLQSHGDEDSTET